MEKITLTRIELYDLIWSEPMLLISRRFHISDTGLRKMCLRLKVPTPYAGYWKQVERGKKVKKTRLNPNYSGGQSSITLERRPEGNSIMSPFVMLKREIEQDYAKAIKVPARMGRTHPLITKASDFLLGEDERHKRSLRNEGLVHNYDGPMISVAPINIRYALRLMNAIILLFINRGHQVDGSYFVINGKRWSFSLKEQIEEIDGASYRKQFKPTGSFAFKVEHYPHTHRWYDTKTKRIGEKLSSILATIELEAKRLEEQQIRQREFQEVNIPNKVYHPTA